MTRRDLERRLNELEKLLLEQAQVIEQQAARIAQQDDHIAHLQDVNQRLLRWRFGRRNEKVIIDGQTILPIEGLSSDREWDGDAAGEPEEAVTVRPRKHRRKRALWSQLYPHLPVHEERIELPADQLFNEDGTRMVPHGCETREELVFTPGTVSIRRIIRQRYGRSDTGEKVATAANPPRIVERGGLANETILGMVVHHAMDCLSYQRIAEMISRLGAPIKRGLVTRGCNAFAQLATPMLNAMQHQLFAADVLHIDGSFIFRQRRDRSRRCQRNPLYAISDGLQVVMRWRPDERHASAADLITGYRGYLVRDEWDGWWKLDNGDAITHVGCNAHARRYFAQTMDHDPDARRIVDLYSRLYAVERAAALSGLSGQALFDHRLELRQQRSITIMDELRDEAKQLAQTRSGDFAAAARYILNHETELRRFLDNGALPVDNNLAERVLRRNAMLRKNRLFFVGPDGGKQIAAMLSLMGSCRLLELNPLDYLTWSLPALLAYRDAPEKHKPDLTPWTPRAYQAHLDQQSEAA